MKESNHGGLETSATTDESADQNDHNDDGMARRQFLGAAAVTVGVTASAGVDGEQSGDGSHDVPCDTAEWKAAGVWEDHLIPARTALTSSDGLDIEKAEKESREALQELEALEVDCGS